MKTNNRTDFKYQLTPDECIRIHLDSIRLFIHRNDVNLVLGLFQDSFIFLESPIAESGLTSEKYRTECQKKLSEIAQNVGMYLLVHKNIEGVFVKYKDDYYGSVSLHFNESAFLALCQVLHRCDKSLLRACIERLISFIQNREYLGSLINQHETFLRLHGAVDRDMWRNISKMISPANLKRLQKDLERNKEKV